jgi:hypothetical protein
MKTQSNHEYQPFEVSGREVRFHWNVELLDKPEEEIASWQADEALALLSDSPQVMLQKLLDEGCELEVAEGILSDFASH